MLLIIYLVAAQVRAQDAAWLLEQAPTASAALLRVLEKAPPFSAVLDASISYSGATQATTATGRIEYQRGNLRWDVNLGNISSAELGTNTRALVRQINGERLLLLAEVASRTNRLVLPGVQACIEQPLTGLKVLSRRTQGTAEKVDGRICSRERWLTVTVNGTTNEIVVWRTKDQKEVPLQMALTLPAATLRVRLREVRLRAVDPQRFRLSPDYSRYNSFEDLLQSVLLAKMRRRLGME